MFGPWQSLLKLLQAFEVQVERLARMGKCLGQRGPARNNFRKVRKFDDVNRILRLVFDPKNVASVIVLR
jgi:hypothetical protein